MRSPTLFAVTVAALATAALAGRAHAQTVTYTPNLDPDRFVLTADPYAVGLTDSARPLGLFDYSLGTALRAGSAPLTVCVQASAGRCMAGGAGDLVSARVGADLVGSLGFGRASLSAQLPVILHQGTDFDSTSGDQLSFAGMGDLRLGGKVLLVGDARTALAYDVRGTVPTGRGDFTTDGTNTTIENRLVVDHRRDRIALDAQLGYAWRADAASVGSLYVKDEILFSVAGEYAITPDRLFAGLAVFGRIGVDSDPHPMPGIDGSPGWEERPIEAMASARYRLTDALSLEGGVGAGLDSGYGPGFRALAALRYLHVRPPAPPELPRPDPDTDHDGIPDRLDHCPLEPEDKDGFEDTDGCPDLDNDQDGIPDAADKCPDEPEDKDGFQDEDGCPDVDNDKDGILDKDDKCPDAPETFNGFQDDDGCPDNVVVTPTQIEIHEQVFFDLDRATIKPVSFQILDEVAQAMTEHPDLHVSVEGHTDDRATIAYNQKLSERRAAAVRQYLIDHGIAADRLTAKGWGKSRPKVPGTSEAARDQNRRVEFLIVK